MGTVIGILLLLVGLGFAGFEIYHLVCDIKARRNKKNKEDKSS